MLRVTIAVSHDSNRGWSLDGHGNGQEVVRLCQAQDIWNCYFLSQVIVITLVTSKCFALSSCFLTDIRLVYKAEWNCKLQWNLYLCLHLQLWQIVAQRWHQQEGGNKLDQRRKRVGDGLGVWSDSGQILSDQGSVLPPVFKFSLAVAHLNTSQQRPFAWSWPWHMIIFDEMGGFSG